MADAKISALSAATTPLAGTEVLPIVQSGATKKVSVADLTAGRDVSVKNLTYTGTLTGSTGVIAIGTNQIYKDASGNVGFGTASPTVKFEMLGDSTTNFIGSKVTNASTASNTTKTATRAFTLRDTGGTYKDVAYITAYPDGVNVISGGLSFSTRTSDATPTEKAYLNSDGVFLVATSVVPSSAGTSGVAVYEVNANAGRVVIGKSVSGTSDGVLFYYSGTYVGGITYSDTAVAYNTSSDYRLKKNVQPMQNALQAVMQLKPVTYQWKSNDTQAQGFIAHELQAIVPDCVTGEKDAVDENGNPIYQGIDTSFLVATLTKAIQEQQEIISLLESRVKSLESK